MLQLVRSIVLVFSGLLLVVAGIFYWLVYDQSKVANYYELHWVDENAIVKIERLSRPFSAYDKLRFYTKQEEIWDYDLKMNDDAKIANLYQAQPPYPFLRLVAFPDPIDQLSEAPKHYVVVQIADERGTLSVYEDNAEQLYEKYKNRNYFGAILMLIGLLVLQLSRTSGLDKRARKYQHRSRK